MYKYPQLLSLFLAGALFVISLTSFCQNSVRDLDLNTQRWDNKKITSYKYTLKVICFCGAAGVSPVLIEVRNDVTKSITNTKTSELVDYPYFSTYETVPKLFSFIKTNMLDPEFSVSEIEYNENLGYPKKIFVTRRGNITDDNISLEISDFEILQ